MVSSTIGPLGIPLSEIDFNQRHAVYASRFRRFPSVFFAVFATKVFYGFMDSSGQNQVPKMEGESSPM